MVGAGKAEGSMDAGNMLKPALARGELHCVGATTLDEYRKYIEKDAALERRFQKVMVNEPTVEDTIAILRGLKETLRSASRRGHHGSRHRGGRDAVASLYRRPAAAGQGHRSHRRGGLAHPHGNRFRRDGVTRSYDGFARHGATHRDRDARTGPGMAPAAHSRWRKRKSIFSKNETAMHRAARSLGLTESQFTTFRDQLLSDKGRWVTLPRHLDAMTWGFPAHRLDDVIIPNGEKGVEIDLTDPSGGTLVVYLPAKCGNLSFVRRRLAVLPNPHPLVASAQSYPAPQEIPPPALVAAVIPVVNCVGPPGVCSPLPPGGGAFCRFGVLCFLPAIVPFLVRGSSTPGTPFTRHGLDRRATPAGLPLKPQAAFRPFEPAPGTLRALVLRVRGWDDGPGSAGTPATSQQPGERGSL